MDVDDAGKSMEGSCESAEAGCCSHEAHTNTEAGGCLWTTSSLAWSESHGLPAAGWRVLNAPS